MSSDNESVPADASLDELHGVGSARSEYLPRETVGELAQSSAQQIANEMDDEMSGGEIEEVVETARSALDDYDGRITAKVYTKADDDDSDEDDADDGATVVEESFGSDADAFVDAGGATLDKIAPEECESVAIIAGDDVFDVDGKHSDMSPEEMAGLVQQRLIEFGFDDAETIYALGSGMGRTAVNAWVRNTPDDELPELKQISVQNENGYPTGDDYRERNQRLLEAVDGICTVANGDYVGMWVNMVNERPDDEVIIRTPALDDE